MILISSDEMNELWEMHQQYARDGAYAAWYKLGTCFMTGEGVAQDFTKAAYSFDSATTLERDDHKKAVAFYMAGICCLKDGKQNDAYLMFSKAADLGLAEAQYNTGVCLEQNIGIPSDYAETLRMRWAVKYYTKAAEQGDARAQYNLANCYAKGLGVPEDFDKAVYWCRKAAEQGLAEAQKTLAALG